MDPISESGRAFMKEKIEANIVFIGVKDLLERTPATDCWLLLQSKWNWLGGKHPWGKPRARSLGSTNSHKILDNTVFPFDSDAK
ncbi:hypothetical protein JYT92_00380 [bacterium AH-315-L15]|nr:hypothetical protein [bacterium AH-315-L15]